MVRKKTYYGKKKDVHRGSFKNYGKKKDARKHGKLPQLRRCSNNAKLRCRCVVRRVSGCSPDKRIVMTNAMLARPVRGQLDLRRDPDRTATRSRTHESANSKGEYPFSKKLQCESVDRIQYTEQLHTLIGNPIISSCAVHGGL